MSDYVEDGFKIACVDNAKLEELRRKNNTLDCGAIKILESLDLFCEDLVDNYEYSSQISYRNLFNSLRTVIKSAYENEKIRNAVITGIIRDTPKCNDVIEKKCSQKVSGARVKELNESEVRAYSATHTISESAECFGVSKEQMKNYVIWHKIEYVKGNCGRKGSLDKARVMAVSESLTVKELAAMFSVKIGTMAKFCERNNIPYKKRGSNV